MSHLFSFRRLQPQTAQNFGCSRMLQGNPILIIALLWTGVGYLVDFLRLLLTFFNLFQKCHKRVSLHNTAGILLRLLCLHITEHQTGKPCFKITYVMTSLQTVFVLQFSGLWSPFHRDWPEGVHDSHTDPHPGTLLNSEPEKTGANFDVGQHAPNGWTGADLLLPPEGPTAHLGP